MFSSKKTTDETFLTAKDYTNGLFQLNYLYTIQTEANNKFSHSNIYSLNHATLTYSLVGPSTGIFACKKGLNKDFLALRFIRQGKEIHHTGDKNYELTAYTIGIFDLQETSYYQRQQITESVNLFIEKNNQTKKLFDILKNSFVLDASAGMTRYLLDSMFHLISEFPNCKLAERQLILDQYIQLFCKWSIFQKENQLNIYKKDLLERATEYIQYYWSDNTLTLEQTAKYCFTSIRTLQQVFAQESIHFSQYVNNLRLSAAAIKLYSTDEEITTIAFECGFNSSAYFSKRFKERYFKSPKDYRKYFSNSLKNNNSDCCQNCCLYK